MEPQKLVLAIYLKQIKLIFYSGCFPKYICRYGCIDQLYKTKNGTAQISIFSNDGTMVLKATLCPATFRKTTTLKFYANGKLVTGELAKSSNDLVKATIEGANEVMKSTMKMTVRDIGFYVF